MILYTYPKDVYGHIKVDFICQICKQPHTKNLSKQPSNICKNCLVGICKFENKALSIHGDKYEYDLSTYIRSTIPMAMFCKTHGKFMKRPNDHLQGQGCPACSKEIKNNNLRKTQDKFIKQINAIYKNNIDLSKVTYTGPDTNVIVVCPAHGDQHIHPSTLMAGQATCKKCLPKFVDTAVFITKAKEVHGEKYLYNNTHYVSARQKVTITCNIHGDFLQNPMGHIAGRGCSKCASRGFNTGKPGYLYYLYLPEVKAYKIGITNFSIEDRYLIYERKQFIVLKLKYYADGSKAKAIEQWLIRRYAKYRFTGNNPLNSGNTEMFNKNVLLCFTQKDRLIASGELTV